MKIERTKQKGAVLITTLVFLVLLTLLSVTTISTTTMEERMALNSQEMAKNLQVADSGISKMFNDELIYTHMSYCDPSDCSDFDDDSVYGDEYGGSGSSGIGVKYRMTHIGDYAGGPTSVEKAYGAGFQRSYFDFEVKATNLNTKQKKLVKSGAYGISQIKSKN